MPSPDINSLYSEINNLSSEIQNDKLDFVLSDIQNKVLKIRQENNMNMLKSIIQEKSLSFNEKVLENPLFKGDKFQEIINYEKDLFSQLKDSSQYLSKDNIYQIQMNIRQNIHETKIRVVQDSYNEGARQIKNNLSFLENEIKQNAERGDFDSVNDLLEEYQLKSNQAINLEVLDQSESQKNISKIKHEVYKNQTKKELDNIDFLLENTGSIETKKLINKRYENKTFTELPEEIQMKILEVNQMSENELSDYIFNKNKNTYKNTKFNFMEGDLSIDTLNNSYLKYIQSAKLKIPLLKGKERAELEKKLMKEKAFIDVSNFAGQNHIFFTKEISNNSLIVSKMMTEDQIKENPEFVIEVFTQINEMRKAFNDFSSPDDIDNFYEKMNINSDTKQTLDMDAINKSQRFLNKFPSILQRNSQIQNHAEWIGDVISKTNFRALNGKPRELSQKQAQNLEDKFLNVFENYGPQAATNFLNIFNEVGISAYDYINDVEEPFKRKHLKTHLKMLSIFEDEILNNNYSLFFNELHNKNNSEEDKNRFLNSFENVNKILNQEYLNNSNFKNKVDSYSGNTKSAISFLAASISGMHINNLEFLNEAESIEDLQKSNNVYNFFSRMNRKTVNFGKRFNLNEKFFVTFQESLTSLKEGEDDNLYKGMTIMYNSIFRNEDENLKFTDGIKKEVDYSMIAVFNALGRVAYGQKWNNINKMNDLEIDSGGALYIKEFEGNFRKPFTLDGRHLKITQNGFKALNNFHKAPKNFFKRIKNQISSYLDEAPLNKQLGKIYFNTIKKIFIESGKFLLLGENYRISKAFLKQVNKDISQEGILGNMEMLKDILSTERFNQVAELAGSDNMIEAINNYKDRNNFVKKLLKTPAQIFNTEVKK